MSPDRVRFLGHEVVLRPRPFVHAVIDDFLPEARYRELAAAFVDPRKQPEGDRYPDGKCRLHFLAPPVPSELAPGAPWERFVAEISSAPAMAEMREVCRRAEEIAPGDPPYDRLAAARQEIAVGDFDLYCEFSSLARGALLRPHSDATFKFLSCVYYFAPEDWRAEWGGATDLFRARGKRGRFNWMNRELDPDDVELAARCEFRPNRLFLFVKGPRSLHGVAPVACPPGVFRRSFNFALEVPRDRYEASVAGPVEREVGDFESRRLAPSLLRRVIRRLGCAWREGR